MISIDTMIKRKNENVCPFCNKDINMDEFRDDESIKEFRISGLCQKCQDNFFF